MPTEWCWATATLACWRRRGGSRARRGSAWSRHWQKTRVGWGLVVVLVVLAGLGGGGVAGAGRRRAAGRQRGQSHHTHPPLPPPRISGNPLPLSTMHRRLPPEHHRPFAGRRHRGAAHHDAAGGGWALALPPAPSPRLACVPPALGICFGSLAGLLASRPASRLQRLPCAGRAAVGAGKAGAQPRRCCRRLAPCCCRRPVCGGDLHRCRLPLLHDAGTGAELLRLCGGPAGPGGMLGASGLGCMGGGGGVSAGTCGAPPANSPPPTPGMHMVAASIPLPLFLSSAPAPSVPLSTALLTLARPPPPRVPRAPTVDHRRAQRRRHPHHLPRVGRRAAGGGDAQVGAGGGGTAVLLVPLVLLTAGRCSCVAAAPVLAARPACSSPPVLLLAVRPACLPACLPPGLASHPSPHPHPHVPSSMLTVPIHTSPCRSSWFGEFRRDVRSSGIVRAVECGIRGVGSATLTATSWTTSKVGRGGVGWGGREGGVGRCVGSWQGHVEGWGGEAGWGGCDGGCMGIPLSPASAQAAPPAAAPPLSSLLARSWRPAINAARLPAPAGGGSRSSGGTATTAWRPRRRPSSLPPLRLRPWLEAAATRRRLPRRCPCPLRCQPAAARTC